MLSPPLHGVRSTRRQRGRFSYTSQAQSFLIDARFWRNVIFDRIFLKLETGCIDVYFEDGPGQGTQTIWS